LAIIGLANAYGLEFIFCRAIAPLAYDSLCPRPWLVLTDAPSASQRVTVLAGACRAQNACFMKRQPRYFWIVRHSDRRTQPTRNHANGPETALGDMTAGGVISPNRSFGQCRHSNRWYARSMDILVETPISCPFPYLVALRSTYPANRPEMLSASSLSWGLRDGPAFALCSVSRAHDDHQNFNFLFRLR
jgi:hypothetical protein